VVLAGLLGATALWVADFSPREWLQAFTLAPPKLQPKPRPEAPIVAVQPRPRGTDSSVSPVPLTLHLVATRPGRNAREGYADIGVDVRSPQTYRAGGLLANGARIEEIYTDYITLTRNGNATRLYLDGKVPVNEQPSAAAVAGTLTVGDVSAHKDAAVDSQELLTDVIRVSPVYEGEALKGLEVYANERSDVFQRLGFEPGDRIQAIDGAPVRDAAAAIGTLRHLTEGQMLMVVVERAGARKTLALDGTIVWEALHRS